MEVKEVFKGVYRIDRRLATLNLIPGMRVYGEELITVNGREYRTWNPYRSKLSAAIMKGLKNMGIKSGADVLYLGAATGTTASHISDIVAEKGSVYCIEISERSMRDLLKTCERRKNMLPMLEDARLTNSYAYDVGSVDILYQDVSAKDQADIFIRNSVFLKKGSFAYVAIKSQSIDVSRRPESVYAEFISKVSMHMKLVEKTILEPYDRMHLFAVFQKPY